ncbi:MAG: hypothetical protein MZW92_31025 [Comamonadaceae bacterium]|nr:hypothetical protein [Comamonadaceae bacterium]
MDDKIEPVPLLQPEGHAEVSLPEGHVLLVNEKTHIGMGTVEVFPVDAVIASSFPGPPR